MKSRLWDVGAFVGIICVVAAGCVGCATNTPNSNNSANLVTLGSNRTAWSNLSQNTKHKLVQSEYAKLNYHGNVSISQTIKSLNSNLNAFTDNPRTLGDVISDELGFEIAFNEENTLTSMSGTTANNQATSFLKSANFKTLQDLERKGLDNE